MLQQIEFLYPIKKSTMHEFTLAPPDRPSVYARIKLRFERLRTLFKGGLFLRFYQVARDEDLPGMIDDHARFVYPSRTFVCAEGSHSDAWMGHIETGFMAEYFEKQSGHKSTEQMVQFISGILEGKRQHRRRILRRQGAFVVLVGLDGSGKTTVARKICCLAAESWRFKCIRYFHWRPRIFERSRFPLPEFRNIPRKAELQNTLTNSVLSALRLLKNGLLSRLAYSLRVQPLKRKGGLVLVDRYFYNYFIDPVSVKYSGPPWLLEKMRALFPCPDLVVILKAPATVLLSRKQELSADQIELQSRNLEQLAFPGSKTLTLDASMPPEQLAARILQASAPLDAN